jgi:hypothetical protein
VNPVAPKPKKAAVAPPVAPKPKKAEGKGKSAKVAVPPVAPKLVKAVALKPEAVADPKDLAKPDKVKLAKAKMQAQNGKVRKLTPSDGWGCAKCRWRFSGCAQCKGKMFTGFVWNSSMKP